MSDFVLTLAKRKKRKIQWVLWLMLTPAVVWTVIFWLIPLFGIVLAFKDYSYSKGIFGSPWNGFANFKFFFQGNRALELFRNTIVYNLLGTVVGTVFCVAMAIFLADVVSRKFFRITQTMLLFPFFISWVIVGAFFYNLFNPSVGFVTNILKVFGVTKLNIYYMPNAWWFLITLTGLWKGIGSGAVMYLAAIMGIDTEIFEAAKVDGTTKFQEAIHITLPNLRPVIIILWLLGVGGMFHGNYDMFQNLTLGSPGVSHTTTVFETYLVGGLLSGSGKFGMLAAGNFMQSVFGLATIFGANALVRKVSPENRLF